MADTTTGTPVAIATPDLEIIEGQITTTSLQIAEHFGKRHDTVLRAIRNMECSTEYRLRNFAESSYRNEQGKEQPCYRLTRDGFVFLAMGFTGKDAAQWKEAYITAFNKMEQELLARTPYAVQPSDTLTEAQQIALRALLESNVKRLPHDKQAGAMVKGWSKLKAHFGVPYRQIPASEFTEAISIVARHVAEWELVDDAPALPHQPTVQEIVADWVRKIDEPNGYPAFLFLPLVEAVQRKTARTTGMLPEAQAREITVRLERLCRLFHPFSDQAGDVIGVLRALRGLHPNSSAHTPGYLQLLPRL